MSLAVVFGATLTAEAANRYVRAGASGSANGNDWANAYTTLPSTLTRGDTYYIADGSYGGYSFDDANSGSLVITIKKAVASDHGTDTGWSSTYGDGQAIFNSILSFSTGNWVFDGHVRNEANWFDGTAYGFQIAHNNNDQNIIITASNVTIKYVFINAKYNSLPNGTGRQYAVDTENGGTKSGLVFHRMYVRGSNNIWFIRNTMGTIIEYSASDGAAGDGNNHGEIVNLYFNVSNSITRFNKFRNAYKVQGPGTAIWAITRCGSTGICGGSNTGHQIYGNEVAHFCTTDGVIGYADSDTTNTVIYNNTFVDGTGPGKNCWGSGIALPASGNVAYNNIWVGWQSLAFSIPSHNYNAFQGASTFGESQGQQGLTTAIFTNYAGNDFTLGSATTAGTTLPVPYNADLSGITHGADGTWDRGAHEYSTGAKSPINPRNLRVLP